MSCLHVDALRAEKINGGVTYEAGPRDAVWERAEVALVDQDLPSDGSGRFAIVVSPVPAESWRVDALLRRDDPQFKKLVDDTMTGVMKSGEIKALYAKWFEKAVPPKNLNFNFPMNDQLKALYANPNDNPFE